MRVHGKGVPAGDLGSRIGASFQTADENAMNNDILQGKWTQFKGKITQQWGKLTDDDLTTAEGHRDRLVGAIQERYGIARDEADRQVRTFENTLSQSSASGNAKSAV